MKPITVARQETIDQLVDICNHSGLPAFCLREILAKLDSVLAQKEGLEYQMDLEKYESEEKENEVHSD